MCCANLREDHEHSGAIITAAFGAAVDSVVFLFVGIEMQSTPATQLAAIGLL